MAERSRKYQCACVRDLADKENDMRVGRSHKVYGIGDSAEAEEAVSNKETG